MNPTTQDAIAIRTLQRQVADLQVERDEARAQLDAANHVLPDLIRLLDEKKMLTKERDQARAQLAEAEQQNTILPSLEAANEFLKDELCEAHAIARRLRLMAHPVDQEDGDVVTAFDALRWAKEDA